MPKLLTSRLSSTAWYSRMHKTTMFPGRAGLLLPLLVAALYFALNVLVLVQGHPHEDAYILFIYSENLAQGNGISYYAGGPPAEGATDFLWMATIALGVKLGFDVALVAAALNALGIAVLTHVVLRIAHDVNGGIGIPATLATILLILLSPIVGGSLAGFGVAFYCGAIAVLLLCMWTTSPRLRSFTPIMGLIVGLIRPDGVILGAVATLVVLLRVRGSDLVGRYLASMLVATVLGLLYFGLRYGYFGHLLPLPLYVKSATDEWLPGLGDNLRWLDKNSALLLLALLGLYRKRSMRLLALALPALVLLGAFAFAIQSQNISYRFQAPATLVLLVYAAVFLASIRKPKDRRADATVVVATLLVTVALVREVREVRDDVEDLLAPSYINVFPHLLEAATDAPPVVALTEAGRFAYWLNGEFHDLVGLNTAATALLGVSEDYLTRIDPDIIFIHDARTRAPQPCPDDASFCELPPASLALREEYRDQDIRYGVIRAPIVVLRYLAARPDEYRVIQARYGSGWPHVYAIRRDSDAISYQAFVAALRESYRHSSVGYLEQH